MDESKATKGTSGLQRCLLHGTYLSLCRKRRRGRDQFDRYECLFRLFCRWLSECLNSHKVCEDHLAGGKLKSIYPSRLIDVGSDTEPPRLAKFGSIAEIREASREARYPGYATLSYCWGVASSKSHLLRAENETSFLQALPQLPKTIEDAVIACRRLGIKFLWCDALCIIQGHDEASTDWQKESSRVGSYYANAILTIAASRAIASDEGCLPTQPYRYFKARWSNLLEKSRDILLCDPNRNIRTSPYVQLSEIREDCALSQRAWVTQELALSPRILWLCSKGAFWSCRDADRAFLDRIYDQDRPHFDTSNPSFWWYRTLSQYSHTMLSFPQDRLPALSGICKYIDQDGDDRYLAGIWESSLSLGLVWERSESFNNKQISVPEFKDLPSWSPISRPSQLIDGGYVGGGTVCGGKRDCSACGEGKLKLHDADIHLQYGDKHGRALFTSLTVDVSIYDAEVSFADHDRQLMSLDSAKLLTSSGYLSFDDGSTRPRPNEPLRVQVALVCHLQDRGPDLYLCFLLLEPTGHAQTYRRVGIFWGDLPDHQWQEFQLGQRIERIVFV